MDTRANATSQPVELLLIQSTRFPAEAHPKSDGIPEIPPEFAKEWEKTGKYGTENSQLEKTPRVSIQWGNKGIWGNPPIQQ